MNSLTTSGGTESPVPLDSLRAGHARRAALPAATARLHQSRIDRVLTHHVTGLAAFLAIMGGLFWMLFVLAAIPMHLLESAFSSLGAEAGRVLPDGPVGALVSEGILGGVAGSLVFLPQICLLFFLISLLEDTGYLARATVVAGRFFHRFGLPGQAFVPLLTAHACAVPALLSTRLIPDRRDRLATIFVVPFMSCSARLPVYVLLTSLLFADDAALAGIAFVACYALGTVAALSSAWLFSRTVLPGRASPASVALPPYRVPSLRKALVASRNQALGFLKTVGTVIMAVCIVMWWLSSYPRVQPSPAAVELRTHAAGLAPGASERSDLLAQAAALDVQAQQRGSYAGAIGQALAPVFRPLGYDWQLTVGLLTSFVAREVFVSTMAVLAADRNEAGVVSSVRRMTRTDGTRLFTPATAASALVFFVLAMQCLPTLATTRRESGGLRYAVAQLAYMSGLAYLGALVTYQVLRVAGVP